MPRQTRLLALAALFALVAAACGDDAPPCELGDRRACSCADGRQGYAACTAAQSGFGACDCDSGTPSGSTTASVGAGGAGGAGGAAAGGASGAGGAAGLLPFMSPCDSDEQCETGLCYDFNAKGPHCTTPCTLDADCPPPSPGCNNMGVCKAP